MSINPLRPRGVRGARYLVSALLAAVPGLLLAGCGGSGGASDGRDSSAPQVSWVYFNPSSMSDTGGTAKIQAQVSDASGIAWVRATLTKPDGMQQVLEMTWQSGGFYQASFDVPSNVGAGELQYSATLSAADRAGNVSSPTSAGTLSVGSDSGPPPPPNL